MRLRCIWPSLRLRNLLLQNAPELSAVPRTGAISDGPIQFGWVLGKEGDDCVRKITDEGHHGERLGIAEGRESGGKMNEHESAVDG